jgi:hypothetical protein
MSNLAILHKYFYQEGPDAGPLQRTGPERVQTITMYAMRENRNASSRTARESGAI